MNDFFLSMKKKVHLTRYYVFMFFNGNLGIEDYDSKSGLLKTCTEFISKASKAVAIGFETCSHW